MARLSTARLILSWAASNDFEIHQIDIKSAYLYGELKNDEIIYVRAPPGDLLPDVKPGQVLKLQKALYGLKQAGRHWYKTLTDILMKLGLTRSEYDNAVFLAKDKTRTVLILFIHVDDITLAGVNLSIIQSFKSSIKTYVEYTDGGDIHWLLGIEIKCNRNERTLMMQQQHYIEQILKRFELENARNVQTPMSPGLQLKSTTELAEEEKTIMKDVPYMSMVGALRYAADCTRPDIAFATSQLARHLQSPGPEHLHAVKHCFQYLKTTRDYWLVLGGKAKEELTGYSDADGMMQEGNKAISGYTFFFGNALVSWSSKRQTLVALSVYEAELQALAHATQEAIALNHLASELLQSSEDPVMIYCDNLGVIQSMTNEEIKHSKLTKHINLKKSFIRCYVKNKTIDLKHILTKDQRADILTKALQAPQVKHLTSLLRLMRV